MACKPDPWEDHATLAIDGRSGTAAFHDPEFAAPVSSAMPWQTLLGMTGFAPTRFEDRYGRIIDAVRMLPEARLCAIQKDPGEPLVRRLAAATLLGPLSDRLIDPLSPSMCDVPAAEVQIGLLDTEVARVAQRYASLGVAESWIRKEVPEHLVSIGAFRMGKFPVTNIEYRRFVIDTGLNFVPNSWYLGRFPIELANHPVHGIPPQAADTYVRWLSDLTGRGFRLPSEAEWEYAAAGVERREFPWGEEFDPFKANTAELGLLTTTPVGIFAEGSSPFGVLDMAGNVEEYVADSYRPYPGGQLITDELYLTDSQYRIARGGSFARYRDLARTRRRHGANYVSPVYVMGFRLAEDIT